jgi:hypothetical protein
VEHIETKSGTATILADKIRSHQNFWAGTPGTGPLIKRSTYGSLGEMHLLLGDGSVATEGLRLEPQQLDGGVLTRAETATGATTMLIAATEPWAADDRADDSEGDAIHVVAPMPKIPWVEAILGCPIVVGVESIWSEPWLDSPTDSDAVRSWREGSWFSKLLETTSALVEAWDEPVQTTQTPMRGPIDLLTALMGDEKTVYALADEPEACRNLLEVCTEAFIEVGRSSISSRGSKAVTFRRLASGRLGRSCVRSATRRL